MNKHNQTQSESQIYTKNKQVIAKRDERNRWGGLLGTKSMNCELGMYKYEKLSSVQSFSHVQLFVDPWTSACQLPCPSPTPGAQSNSCPSSWWCHLILCHPLLCLASIFPSTRVFPSESVLHIRWPNYWSFSFNISPSNDYSGLISFKVDRLDLLVVKGLSRVFSSTTVQKHQFFDTQLSL